MPLQELCVLCAKPLPIPRRADARYCRRSTCRVQAYRARRQSGVQPGAKRPVWRLPVATAAAPSAGQGTQLAAFRLLRQTQKQAAQLAAQLAQAHQDDAQLRRAHDPEAQTLKDLLNAARQQTAQLAESLLESQAQVQTQTEADAQATARWTQEQKRATQLAAQITDLEREASTQRTARLECERKWSQEQQRVRSLRRSLQESQTLVLRQQEQLHDFILELSEHRAQAFARKAAAKSWTAETWQAEIKQLFLPLQGEPAQAPLSGAARVPVQTPEPQGLVAGSREPEPRAAESAEKISAEPSQATLGAQFQAGPLAAPSPVAQTSAAFGKIGRMYPGLSAGAYSAPAAPSVALKLPLCENVLVQQTPERDGALKVHRPYRLMKNAR